jgi:AcrR family transcriptional regulator
MAVPAAGGGSDGCAGLMAQELRSRQPGPRRRPGSPSGPDEVRRAVLEAAGTLFALRGIDAVSLRDIAARADVHLSLIGRYVGTRAELVLAVFDYLSDQVAQAVVENPLSGQGFEPDTVMGKWVRVAGALVIAGWPVGASARFNPVQAMATTLEEGYGLRPAAARLRAAQIVAAALGWRIFEDYLVQAGGLEAIPLATLREELARSARRLGATPWPSPPDPQPRRR